MIIFPIRIATSWGAASLHKLWTKPLAAARRDEAGQGPNAATTDSALTAASTGASKGRTRLVTRPGCDWNGWGWWGITIRIIRSQTHLVPKKVPSGDVQPWDDSWIQFETVRDILKFKIDFKHSPRVLLNVHPSTRQFNIFNCALRPCAVPGEWKWNVQRGHSRKWSPWKWMCRHLAVVGCDGLRAPRISPSASLTVPPVLFFGDGLSWW